MPPVKLPVRPRPEAPPRRERLAINLFDLDRVTVLVREILLVGKLDASTPILVDKDRPDEVAVAFTCDLLTSACICDTLREHDRRAKDFPTRVYLRRASAWEKVAGAKHLSVVKGEQVMLNPELFAPQALAVGGLGLEDGKMEF